MPRFFFEFDERRAPKDGDGEAEALDKIESCELQLLEGCEAASTQIDALGGSSSSRETLIDNVTQPAAKP